MESITESWALQSNGPLELSVANIRLETGNEALLACSAARF